MSRDQRKRVLAGLVVAVAALCAILLWDVFVLVFFAITIAYILSPLRSFLVDHGMGRRLAATFCTTLVFFSGLVLFAPIVISLYVRREEIALFFETLPDTITLSAGGYSYAVDVASQIEKANQLLSDVAIDAASQLPVIALELFIFALIVYVLLLRPREARDAILDPIPSEYHDIAFAYHERLRSILYAIYVLQAAVALGTFLMAYPFYLILGYEPAFTLAVISGMLQFLPIVGPSIVVIGLAVMDVAAGAFTQAIIVTVLGLTVIGLLPDVLIRPRLARLTAGMPGSLYFVGFTGGLLSVGAIGVIAGPVAVALVAESVELLSEEVPGTKQTQLNALRQKPPDEPPPPDKLRPPATPTEPGDGATPRDDQPPSTG